MERHDVFFCEIFLQSREISQKEWEKERNPTVKLGVVILRQTAVKGKPKLKKINPKTTNKAKAVLITLSIRNEDGSVPISEI